MLTLDELKLRYVRVVLKRTGGNKEQAAKILDVSLKTIYNLLKRAGKT